MARDNIMSDVIVTVRISLISVVFQNDSKLPLPRQSFRYATIYEVQYCIAPVHLVQLYTMIVENRNA